MAVLLKSNDMVAKIAFGFALFAVGVVAAPYVAPLVIAGCETVVAKRTVLIAFGAGLVIGDMIATAGSENEAAETPEAT